MDGRTFSFTLDTGGKDADAIAEWLDGFIHVDDSGCGEGAISLDIPYLHHTNVEVRATFYLAYQISASVYFGLNDKFQGTKPACMN
jgi:hypothetical protein